MTDRKPRVVLFAYGEIGATALDVLESLGATTTAVVMPQNRATAHDPLREAASRRGISIWTQRAGAPAELVAQLKDAAPDVVLTWSYSMRLTADMIAVPSRGAVNVHGGLLPNYRGGHVMQWAILNGEKEFGVTLHYMDSRMDTGPVIGEERFAVADGDDAVVVRGKLKAGGAALLERWWPSIVDGTAPRVAQDEGRARYWRLRAVEEGEIDWSKPAEEICRLVRALACNTPGAFTYAGDKVLSIRRADVLRDGQRGTPGAFAKDPRGLRIAASDAHVLVTEAEIDDKRYSATALHALCETSPRVPGLSR